MWTPPHNRGKVLEVTLANHRCNKTFKWKIIITRLDSVREKKKAARPGALSYNFGWMIKQDVLVHLHRQRERHQRAAGAWSRRGRASPEDPLTYISLLSSATTRTKWGGYSTSRVREELPAKMKLFCIVFTSKQSICLTFHGHQPWIQMSHSAEAFLPTAMLHRSLNKGDSRIRGTG